MKGLARLPPPVALLRWQHGFRLGPCGRIGGEEAVPVAKAKVNRCLPLASTGVAETGDGGES